MAMIPPPTPLLAGRPTCQAQPPDASYSPAMVMVERMYGTSSDLMTCSPVTGFRPLLASTAPIQLRGIHADGALFCVDINRFKRVCVDAIVFGKQHCQRLIAGIRRG